MRCQDPSCHGNHRRILPSDTDVKMEIQNFKCDAGHTHVRLLLRREGDDPCTLSYSCWFSEDPSIWSIMDAVHDMMTSLANDIVEGAGYAHAH